MRGGARHLPIMTRKNRFEIGRRVRLWSLLLICVGALAQACGGTVTSSPLAPTPPNCNGATCACEQGGNCDVTTATCGDSCALACEAQSVCGGACGESCSVACVAQASCTITLGKSGSITCQAGSTCAVTCLDECAVTCADGATCTLECRGDGAFQTVHGGAGC